MKVIKLSTSFAFVLFGLGGLNAQTTVAAVGGESTGTGGTVSYTVGQIIYTTNIGANGSLAQGVQQPYEISTTLGINETSINLELFFFLNFQ